MDFRSGGSTASNTVFTAKSYSVALDGTETLVDDIGDIAEASFSVSNAPDLMIQNTNQGIYEVTWGYTTAGMYALEVKGTGGTDLRLPDVIPDPSVQASPTPYQPTLDQITNTGKRFFQIFPGPTVADKSELMVESLPAEVEAYKDFNVRVMPKDVHGNEQIGFGDIFEVQCDGISGVATGLKRTFTLRRGYTEYVAGDYYYEGKVHLTETGTWDVRVVLVSSDSTSPLVVDPFNNNDGARKEITVVTTGAGADVTEVLSIQEGIRTQSSVTGVPSRVVAGQPIDLILSLRDAHGNPFNVWTDVWSSPSSSIYTDAPDRILHWLGEAYADVWAEDVYNTDGPCDPTQVPETHDPFPRWPLTTPASMPPGCAMVSHHCHPFGDPNDASLPVNQVSCTVGLMVSGSYHLYVGGGGGKLSSIAGPVTLGLIRGAPWLVKVIPAAPSATRSGLLDGSGATNEDPSGPSPVNLPDVEAHSEASILLHVRDEYGNSIQDDVFVEAAILAAQGSVLVERFSWSETDGFWKATWKAGNGAVGTDSVSVVLDGQKVAGTHGDPRDHSEIIVIAAPTDPAATKLTRPNEAGTGLFDLDPNHPAKFQEEAGYARVNATEYVYILPGIAGGLPQDELAIDAALAARITTSVVEPTGVTSGLVLDTVTTGTLGGLMFGFVVTKILRQANDVVVPYEIHVELDGTPVTHSPIYIYPTSVGLNVDESTVSIIRTGGVEENVQQVGNGVAYAGDTGLLPALSDSLVDTPTILRAGDEVVLKVHMKDQFGNNIVFDATEAPPQILVAGFGTSYDVLVENDTYGLSVAPDESHVQPLASFTPLNVTTTDTTMAHFYNADPSGFYALDTDFPGLTSKTEADGLRMVQVAATRAGSYLLKFTPTMSTKETFMRVLLSPAEGSPYSIVGGIAGVNGQDYLFRVTPALPSIAHFTTLRNPANLSSTDLWMTKMDGDDVLTTGDMGHFILQPRDRFGNYCSTDPSSRLVGTSTVMRGNPTYGYRDFSNALIIERLADAHPVGNHTSTDIPSAMGSNAGAYHVKARAPAACDEVAQVGEACWRMRITYDTAISPEDPAVEVSYTPTPLPVKYVSMMPLADVEWVGVTDARRGIPIVVHGLDAFGTPSRTRTTPGGLQIAPVLTHVAAPPANTVVGVTYPTPTSTWSGFAWNDARGTWDGFVTMDEAGSLTITMAMQEYDPSTGNVTTGPSTHPIVITVDGEPDAANIDHHLMEIDIDESPAGFEVGTGGHLEVKVYERKPGLSTLTQSQVNGDVLAVGAPDPLVRCDQLTTRAFKLAGGCRGRRVFTGTPFPVTVKAEFSGVLLVDGVTMSDPVTITAVPGPTRSFRIAWPDIATDAALSPQLLRAGQLAPVITLEVNGSGVPHKFQGTTTGTVARPYLYASDPTYEWSRQMYEAVSLTPIDPTTTATGVLGYMGIPLVVDLAPVDRFGNWADGVLYSVPEAVATANDIALLEGDYADIETELGRTLLQPYARPAPPSPAGATQLPREAGKVPYRPGRSSRFSVMPKRLGLHVIRASDAVTNQPLSGPTSQIDVVPGVPSVEKTVVNGSRTSRIKAGEENEFTVSLRDSRGNDLYDARPLRDLAYAIQSMHPSLVDQVNYEVRMMRMMAYGGDGPLDPRFADILTVGLTYADGTRVPGTVTYNITDNVWDVSITTPKAGLASIDLRLLGHPFMPRGVTGLLRVEAGAVSGATSFLTGALSGQQGTLYPGQPRKAFIVARDAYKNRLGLNSTSLTIDAGLQFYPNGRTSNNPADDDRVKVSTFTSRSTSLGLGVFVVDVTLPTSGAWDLTLTLGAERFSRSAALGVTHLPLTAVAGVPDFVAYPLSLGCRTPMLSDVGNTPACPFDLSPDALATSRVRRLDLVAGQTAELLVLLRDAYGNAVSSTASTVTGTVVHPYTEIRVIAHEGAEFLAVTGTPLWSNLTRLSRAGEIAHRFTPTKAGPITIEVRAGNAVVMLHGLVRPGPMSHTTSVVVAQSQHHVETDGAWPNHVKVVGYDAHNNRLRYSEEVFHGGNPWTGMKMPDLSPTPGVWVHLDNDSGTDGRITMEAQALGQGFWVAWYTTTTVMKGSWSGSVGEQGTRFVTRAPVKVLAGPLDATQTEMYDANVTLWSSGQVYKVSPGQASPARFFLAARDAYGNRRYRGEQAVQHPPDVLGFADHRTAPHVDIPTPFMSLRLEGTWAGYIPLEHAYTVTYWDEAARDACLVGATGNAALVCQLKFGLYQVEFAPLTLGEIRLELYHEGFPVLFRNGLPTSFEGVARSIVGLDLDDPTVTDLTQVGVGTPGNLNGSPIVMLDGWRRELGLRSFSHMFGPMLEAALMNVESHLFVSLRDEMGNIVRELPDGWELVTHLTLDHSFTASGNEDLSQSVLDLVTRSVGLIDADRGLYKIAVTFPYTDSQAMSGQDYDVTIAVQLSQDGVLVHDPTGFVPRFHPGLGYDVDTLTTPPADGYTITVKSDSAADIDLTKSLVVDKNGCPLVAGAQEEHAMHVSLKEMANVKVIFRDAQMYPIHETHQLSNTSLGFPRTGPTANTTDIPTKLGDGHTFQFQMSGIKAGDMALSIRALGGQPVGPASAHGLYRLRWLPDEERPLPYDGDVALVLGGPRTTGVDTELHGRVAQVSVEVEAGRPVLIRTRRRDVLGNMYLHDQRRGRPRMNVTMEGTGQSPSCRWRPVRPRSYRYYRISSATGGNADPVVSRFPSDRAPLMNPHFPGDHVVVCLPKKTDTYQTNVYDFSLNDFVGVNDRSKIVGNTTLTIHTVGGPSFIPRMSIVPKEKVYVASGLPQALGDLMTLEVQPRDKYGNPTVERERVRVLHADPTGLGGDPVQIASLPRVQVGVFATTGAYHPAIKYQHGIPDLVGERVDARVTWKPNHLLAAQFALEEANAYYVRVFPRSPGDYTTPGLPTSELSINVVQNRLHPNEVPAFVSRPLIVQTSAGGVFAPACGMEGAGRSSAQSGRVSIIDVLLRDRFWNPIYDEAAALAVTFEVELGQDAIDAGMDKSLAVDTSLVATESRVRLKITYTRPGSTTLLVLANGTPILPDPFTILVTPAPPVAVDAARGPIMSNDGFSLSLYFTARTNRGVPEADAGSEPDADCATYFDAATVARVGAEATCFWPSPLHLEVLMGSTATLVPGEALTLKADTIYNVNYSSMATQGTFTVAAPTAPESPVIYAEVPTSISACADVTVDASQSSGNMGRSSGLTFTFLVEADTAEATTLVLESLADPLNSASGTSGVFSIPNSYLTKGSMYTLTITAENAFGATYATTQTYAFAMGTVPTPTLMVPGGLGRITVRRNDEVRVPVTVNFPDISGCGSDVDIPAGLDNDTLKLLTYQWTLEEGPLITGFATESERLQHVRSLTSRTLTIPRGVLSPGETYKFDLTATPSAAGFDAFSGQLSVEITVIAGPIKGRIIGGDMVVPSGMPFSVEAAPVDEDEVPGEVFSFAWTCDEVDVDGNVVSTKCWNDANVQDQVLGSSTERLDVSVAQAQLLTPAKNYRFSVKLSKPPLSDPGRNVTVSTVRTIGVPPNPNRHRPTHGVEIYTPPSLTVSANQRLWLKGGAVPLPTNYVFPDGPPHPWPADEEVWWPGDADHLLNLDPPEAFLEWEIVSGQDRFVDPAAAAAALPSLFTTSTVATEEEALLAAGDIPPWPLNGAWEGELADLVIPAGALLPGSTVTLALKGYGRAHSTRAEITITTAQIPWGGSVIFTGANPGQENVTEYVMEMTGWKTNSGPLQYQFLAYRVDDPTTPLDASATTPALATEAHLSALFEAGLVRSLTKGYASSPKVTFRLSKGKYMVVGRARDTVGSLRQVVHSQTTFIDVGENSYGAGIDLSTLAPAPAPSPVAGASQVGVASVSSFSAAPVSYGLSRRTGMPSLQPGGSSSSTGAGAGAGRRRLQTTTSSSSSSSSSSSPPPPINAPMRTSRRSLLATPRPDPLVVPDDVNMSNRALMEIDGTMQVVLDQLNYSQVVAILPGLVQKYAAPLAQGATKMESCGKVVPLSAAVTRLVSAFRTVVTHMDPFDALCMVADLSSHPQLVTPAATLTLSDILTEVAGHVLAAPSTNPRGDRLISCVARATNNILAVASSRCGSAVNPLVTSTAVVTGATVTISDPYEKAIYDTHVHMSSISSFTDPLARDEDVRDILYPHLTVSLKRTVVPSTGDVSIAMAASLQGTTFNVTATRTNQVPGDYTYAFVLGDIHVLDGYTGAFNRATSAVNVTAAVYVTQSTLVKATAALTSPTGDPVVPQPVASVVPLFPANFTVSLDAGRDETYPWALNPDVVPLQKRLIFAPDFMAGDDVTYVDADLPDPNAASRRRRRSLRQTATVAAPTGFTTGSSRPSYVNSGSSTAQNVGLMVAISLLVLPVPGLSYLSPFAALLGFFGMDVSDPTHLAVIVGLSVGGFVVLVVAVAVAVVYLDRQRRKRDQQRRILPEEAGFSGDGDGVVVVASSPKGKSSSKKNQIFPDYPAAGAGAAQALAHAQAPPGEDLESSSGPPSPAKPYYPDYRAAAATTTTSLYGMPRPRTPPPLPPGPPPAAWVPPTRRLPPLSGPPVAPPAGAWSGLQGGTGTGTGTTMDPAAVGLAVGAGAGAAAMSTAVLGVGAVATGTGRLGPNRTNHHNNTPPTGGLGVSTVGGDPLTPKPRPEEMDKRMAKEAQKREEKERKREEKERKMEEKRRRKEGGGIVGVVPPSVYPDPAMTSTGGRGGFMWAPEAGGRRNNRDLHRMQYSDDDDDDQV